MGRALYSTGMCELEIMPSSRKILLTIPNFATQAHYIAPDDGWVRLSKIGNKVGELLELGCIESQILDRRVCIYPGLTIACMLPVRKGHTFYAFYNTTSTNTDYDSFFIACLPGLEYPKP